MTEKMPLSTMPELDPDPQRETPNEWTMVKRPLL